MTIWESPVTNPREYRTDEPPRCPLWVLAVSVLVLFGLCQAVGGVWHDGPAAERSVQR